MFFLPRSTAVLACAVLAWGFAASAAWASADLPITRDDADRLAGYDHARAEAISAAQAGGDAATLTELEAVLAGEPQPMRGEDIRGDYRCRSIQMDGVLPVVVYGWFKCKIDEDDLGYRIVKLTGSQRFTGHFIDADERYLVFWGAGHYDNEAPRPYGADHERDLVGRFVKAGKGRYRLEMPLTKFDSRLEIIELRRR